MSSSFLTGFHYASCVSIAVLPTFASALGQARITRAALQAMDEQPLAESTIKKLLLATLALSETVILISVGLAYYFLFNAPVLTEAHAWARAGIALALIIPGVIIGYGASFAGAHNFSAVARQPLLGGKIMTFMFITQSLMQTPLFCNSIFAFLIQNNLTPASTLYDGLQLGAVGLMLGLGALGPCLGLTYFIAQASAALRIQRTAYAAVSSSTYISQTVIETPYLLAFVLAVLMLQVPSAGLLKAVACFAAALTVGFANFGPCVSSAWVCSRVLPAIGHNPTLGPLVSRYTLSTQAVIDTSVIYGLLIGAFMLFS